MDDLEERLANCFITVFPEIERSEALQATSLSIAAWDSVAGVTLLAVVEEEFGIAIEIQDLSELTSYQGYLKYLQNEFDMGSEVPRAISSEH